MLCFRKDLNKFQCHKSQYELMHVKVQVSAVSIFISLRETIKTKSNIYSILNWDLGYHSVTKCDISVRYISFFKGKLKKKN